MKLLAIDTATDACSAAIYADGQTFARFEVAPREHNRLLFAMCDEVLAEAQLTAAQLDAVAFGRGPGSFTGVRIAAAYIQALAYAHNLPVATVSDLQVLAQSMFKQPECSQVLSLINARMGETYYGFFERDKQGIMQAKGEEGIATQADYDRFRQFNGAIVGSGMVLYPDLEEEGKAQSCNAELLPAAEAMIPIALDKINRYETCTAEEAVPVYLHRAVK